MLYIIRMLIQRGGSAIRKKPGSESGKTKSYGSEQIRIRYTEKTSEEPFKILVPFLGWISMAPLGLESGPTIATSAAGDAATTATN